MITGESESMRFDSARSEAVWTATLDGMFGEDVIGNVDTCVWNGRVVFVADEEMAQNEDGSDAGAIVESNSQGFVSVVYYATDRELNDAWHQIQDWHNDRECCTGEDD